MAIDYDLVDIYFSILVVGVYLSNWLLQKKV